MSLGGLAQSNLGIQSKSGDLFTVQLDNELLANNLDSIFKVFDLSFGSHTLDLTLENGEKVSKSIYLKNGTEHWFELKVDSNQSKISFYNTFPTAQSDTVTTGRTLINQPAVLNQLAPEPINESESAPVIELDSLALDSIAKLDFSVTYTGQRGCAKPISNFDSKLVVLSSEEFNSRRLKKVQSSLSEECLSVKQLSQVLSLFEFEDHKLEIVGLLKTHIFDLDNIQSLESQFLLHRNLKKFNSLIHE